MWIGWMTVEIWACKAKSCKHLSGFVSYCILGDAMFRHGIASSPVLTTVSCLIRWPRFSVSPLLLVLARQSTAYGGVSSAVIWNQDQVKLMTLTIMRFSSDF